MSVTEIVYNYLHALCLTLAALPKLPRHFVVVDIETTVSGISDQSVNIDKHQQIQSAHNSYKTKTRYLNKSPTISESLTTRRTTLSSSSTSRHFKSN